VYGVFLEAGGTAADPFAMSGSIPFLPSDPADAAEEEAIDAFDDEYGVDIFNPWAEHDLDDAMADQGVGRVWR